MEEKIIMSREEFENYEKYPEVPDGMIFVKYYMKGQPSAFMGEGYYTNDFVACSTKSRNQRREEE